MSAAPPADERPRVDRDAPHPLSATPPNGLTPPTSRTGHRQRALVLLCFFAIGALIAFVPPALTASRPSLVVQVPRGASPSEVEALIDEAVLVEIGLALGWRGDPLIRDRLVRDLRFAGQTGDESTLLDLAEHMDLHRRDPLVRARLVDRAREQLQRLTSPDDATLRALYGTQRDRFTSPTVVTFDHVFIANTTSAPTPSAAATARAETVLDALKRGAEGSTHTTPNANIGGAAQPLRTTEPITGDSELALGPSPTRSLPALARTLGPDFAAALAKAPIGSWVGPLPSRAGLHLVRVQRRIVPAEPSFSALRPALDSAWRTAQLPRIERERLRSARAAFTIELTP